MYYLYWQPIIIIKLLIELLEKNLYELFNIEESFH